MVNNLKPLEATRQTSPRSIRLVPGNIPDYALRPRKRLAFPILICGHLAVGCLFILGHHVRSGELLEELADALHYS